LVAALPVTGFSAFSCAAVPGAGPLKLGCPVELDGVELCAALEPDPDVLVLDVVALAIVAPPTAAAATATPVTRLDLMFLTLPLLREVVGQGEVDGPADR
jgi:hypothetical protein